MEIIADERRAAWDLAYCTALEQLPDAEIAWELHVWRRADHEDLAALCERVLSERQEWDLSLSGGAQPADLDVLLARTPLGPVARLMEHDALPLVSALRVAYHAGRFA